MKRKNRHSGIDECYFDSLDNAAKLFPAITDARSPNVFRISAVLRDEVDPVILKEAVERALLIMPAFSLKLHSGLFWYYFDVNNAKPAVKKEYTYPCAPIYRAEEKDFLFRVTYYEKRINFEIYHALSDGMGAMNFMRLIVCCYYNRLLGDTVPEEDIRREAAEISRDFDEDSFISNVTDSEKGEKKPSERAFHISGYRYDGTRLGTLGIHTEADKLLELAKKYDATLSEYLCTLLIWSIYNTSYRRSARNRPIVVSIPVNLRGMFDSNTLRNFFGHMSIGIKPSRTMSFDAMLLEVKGQFKENMTKSRFEDQINAHVNIERIPGIRFVPLVLKNVVMRIIYRNTEKKYTITLSNLGRVKLPESVDGLIDRFEALIGGSRTHPKKVSVCTYKNKLSLMFSSTIDDNSLERFLISQLTSEGIEVYLSSNDTPPPIKPTKAEKKAEKAEKRMNKQAERAEKKQLKAEKKLAGKEAKRSKKAKIEDGGDSV